MQPGDIEYILISLIMGIPIAVILGILLLIYRLLESKEERDVNNKIKN